MNFMSFNTEYESRLIYANQTMKTLTQFQSFFDTLYKNLIVFSVSTTNALQLVFDDLIQYDNTSSLSKHFFDFYRLFEIFLTKAKQISDKINYELVKPIELIHLHLQEKNTEALNDLKDIINSVSEQKKLHEVSKHNYFDACKTAEKQEEKVIQSLDAEPKETGVNNNNNANGNTAEKEHDFLVQYRTIAENNCQYYKQVLKNTNEFYDETERKYGPIAKRLRDNEESRKNFLKYHLEKLYSFIDDFQSSLSHMTTSLKETVVEINIEADLVKYDEKFSYYNKPNMRINKESFLQYDIYRRNFEAMINSNLKMFKSIPIDVSVKQLSDFNHKPVKYQSTKKYSFESRDDLIIASLFNDNNIDKRDKALFQMKLKNRKDFAKDFIDKLLERCYANNTSIGIKVEHLDKLIAISECLAYSALNDNVIKEMFDLNFAIIYIAESTFFQLPNDQRLYSTRVLSELYSYFKSKSYWKKMLMLYLSSELDKRTQEQMKNKAKGKGDNKEKESVLFNIALFNTSKSNEEYKHIMNDIQAKDLLNMIKEFLIHFGIFSVDSNDFSDILIETSNIYKLESDQLSLLITIANSNLHSIKAKRQTSHPTPYSKSNKQLIPINQGVLNQNFINKKALQSKGTHQCSLLLSSLKYLNQKEYINILCLNNLFYNKTSKYIYKSLLWDNTDLPFNKRMIIWKNILQYSLNNSNTTPYASSLEKALSSSSPFTEVIDLDIMRTKFDSNQDANRLKTSNILKTLSYLHTEIGYCQGMSYIASFLISITENESESFEVFNAILSKTNYANLIANDFALLKKYFYVFDRLLVIFIPEVSAFLKSIGLSASYYIAPWFITLFSNSYSYLPNGQSPTMLIRILDLYFLNGWNSIINVGLCLMIYYESTIINMKVEEVFHFLINDICKYEFFHSSNYERFITMYNRIKVSSGLISNIENEYEQERKIIKKQLH